MATFSKTLLSGSVNGKQILVTSASSPGNVVHTAVSGTNSFDEVWLYAHNMVGSVVPLTIAWGGTTQPDWVVTYIDSLAGRALLVDGKLLQNGLSITAFAGGTNVIVLDGFVNRIT